MYPDTLSSYATFDLAKEGFPPLDSLPIRRVIELVSTGALRIPAFQRGFVWDADRVAFLMDSIYKGYPFGAAILWRTREQLKSEKALGPFPLQPHEENYPVDYVLDGQQRLTSIFGVFQTDIEPTDDASWRNVYFDLEASDDLQESQFIAIANHDDVDPARHFPLGTFFDSVAYRKATDRLAPEKLEVIDRVQATFKEAQVPIQYIETE